MLSHGLTGLHDAGVELSDIELFKRAIDLGRLPVRNYAMIICPGGLCPQLPSEHIHHGPQSRLYVRSVKMVMDGALGSWGAAMIDPYTDAPDKTGLVRMPREQIAKLVGGVMDKGYQVNIHCIGDLANKLGLDAFEKAMARRRGGGKQLRPRIEHAQILRREDVPRFAKLGVIPSVQPTHCTSDMGYAVDRIGEERAKGAYVWREFLDGGVEHLALGSDFPIEKVDPMKGIYSAVTRKYEDGTNPGKGIDGWMPEQKLTRSQALRGFTLSAAYASFQEEKLGTLSPGKYADFVIFAKDWLNETTVPDLEILNMRPDVTVISGVAQFGRLF
ncbi:hypothetical protein HK101_011763 [Irineochytrium annulatum]|nr:hypothetical protein HK101_011763 [Irineochytrium annulatum]